MSDSSENLPATPDGPDLEALRHEIDELQKVPTEEYVNPTPEFVDENLPTPEPTDAIGSEDWSE